MAFASGKVRGAVALCLAVAALLWGRGASSATTRVVDVHLAGVVNPIQARHVRLALERAASLDAELVVLTIDTPGGLVSSMQEIVQAIVGSPVPVVGLVAPGAAQATSAGALILLSTDVAAMLPGTRVGAAHPVGDAGPLEGVLDTKATSSVAALAKSLAERRGRPVPAAEGMVRDSTSYTATEAQGARVIELVVTGEEELLERLDGWHLAFPDRDAALHTRGAERTLVPLGWTSRLLDSLAEPTVASLLTTVGILGILYELSAPGIGLGGIVGITALLLGLLGLSVLPIQAGGVLLLVAGAVALLLEAHTPAHGLLGFGGLGALVVGSVVLIDETSYFGAVQRPDLQVLGAVIGTLGVALGAMSAAARRALRAAPRSGVEALPGARGTVTSALTPAGEVLVDGTHFGAVADQDVAVGESIEVLEVLHHPMRLRVRRRTDGD